MYGGWEEPSVVGFGVVFRCLLGHTGLVQMSLTGTSLEVRVVLYWRGGLGNVYSLS